MQNTKIVSVLSGIIIFLSGSFSFASTAVGQDILVAGSDCNDPVPFEKQMHLTVAEGVPAVSANVSVPEGMILVVEHVSATISISSGLDPLLHIDGSLSSDQVASVYPEITYVYAGEDSDVYTANDSVLLFAAGSTRVVFGKYENEGEAEATVWLIGHLICE